MSILTLNSTNISTFFEFISVFSSISLDTIQQNRMIIYNWLKTSQNTDVLFKQQLQMCEDQLEDIVSFRMMILKICKSYLQRSENIYLWTKDDAPINSNSN